MHQIISILISNQPIISVNMNILIANCISSLLMGVTQLEQCKMPQFRKTAAVGRVSF